MNERRTRSGGLFGRRGRGNGGAAPSAGPDPAATGSSPGGSWPPDEATDARTAAIRELETAIRAPDAAPAAPAAPRGSRLAGPAEAFLRHPLIAILPVLLLAGGAIAIAETRDPTYTAKARVKVGREDVPAHILQNAAYGNQVVALSYSAAIASGPVIQEAARETGLTPAETRSRLDASLVPESTLIAVEAEGPTAQAATDLANAGSRAMIDYVTEVARTNDVTQRLLDRFRRAQAKLTRVERRLRRVQRGNDARRIARAQIDVDAARLEADQLANVYRAQATADETAGAHLSLLAPAGVAESDKRDVLEQMLIIAVAGGLVLGFALALLRANWAALRSRRG